MGNMEIVTLEVGGIRPAIFGMRNPANSWGRSDSYTRCLGDVIIGEKDMVLAQNLVRRGAEHGKFLRQIQVWANFTMPRYWWSEFDTYHFNSKNSCSTMYRLLVDGLTMDDVVFDPDVANIIEAIVEDMDTLKHSYDQAKLDGDIELANKRLRQAKQILPEGMLQMRTVNTNYAELMNVYHQRKNHRLKAEWQDTFCAWCETLPYFKELCIEPFEKE